MKKQQKSAKKHRGLIAIGVLLGLVAVLIFAYIIYQHMLLDRETNTIRDIAEQVVDDDPLIDEDIPSEDDTAYNGIDPYLLRRIDFVTLQGINTSATRWMTVPNTGIDSYVLQEEVVGEYEYNLRDIRHKYNGFGSFLVPATPGEITDAHTLVLGHRMNSYYGEWMFSELPKRWGTSSGATNYPYVYVYYADHSERWRIWSACDAMGDDIVYDVPYSLGSEDYENLLQHISSDLARYEMTDTPDAYTETLMLSTCNRQNGGQLGRFLVCYVPDALYYYDTETLVDWNEEHQRQIWDLGTKEAEQEEQRTDIQVIDEPAVIQ